MVNFVGAGPGAADLITVRGKELLENADIIIYAGSLVNPILLDYARETCEIYNSATMTLEEVTDVMIKGEREGKAVVRLHTGDPAIYGAIREQMDILDEHNIEYDERHIVDSNPTYDELKLWIEKSNLDIKKFFNTSGLVYKELQLKDKLPSMSDDEMLKLLATNGMLVKRPLLVDEDQVLIGFKESEWKERL